jgi:hypothetical protein
MRLRILSVLLLALAPLPAQAPTDLKKDLAAREAKAKSDPAALVEVANWAKEKGLADEATRIFQKVLKADPQNRAANEALGMVEFDGKWMPKDKAKILQKRALEAEYAAKGLVDVAGVWVEKAHVADAKRGIFHHDGELVSKAEKLALLEGNVRHPRTGEFVPAADAEKAKTQFRTGEDRWVDEAEADSFHSDPNRPWIVRTFHATVISALPLKTIETEIKPIVDGAFDHGAMRALFNDRKPLPANRPVVLITANNEQFIAIGTAIGAEGSAHGAFLATGTIQAAGLGEVTPAVANWHKDWGPFYVRDAAALAYLHALTSESKAELPLWFTRGVGGLMERHSNDEHAKFFGKQHLAKGGVKDLANWFSSFTISGDLEVQQIDYNIYQAGLLVSFCLYGGDKEATEAMQAVTASFEKDGRTIERAVQKLERILVKKEAELRAYLHKVTTKE